VTLVSPRIVTAVSLTACSNFRSSAERANSIAPPRIARPITPRMAARFSHPLLVKASTTLATTSSTASPITDARVAAQTRLTPPSMASGSTVNARLMLAVTAKMSQKLSPTAAHSPVCVGVVKPTPRGNFELSGHFTVSCSAWMMPMIVVPIRIAATRCVHRARSGHSTGIHSSTRVARNCSTPNRASGDHSSEAQLHASHAIRHSIHLWRSSVRHSGSSATARSAVTASAIPRPMLPVAVEMGCSPTPSMAPHRCRLDQSIRDAVRVDGGTLFMCSVAGTDASTSM